MPKNHLTAADIIVLSALVILAAVLIAVPAFRNTGGTILTVTFENQTIEHPLVENRTFNIESNGIKLTAVCENGQVSVTESGCADKICVSTGSISKPGQAIVCLPAKVSFVISGTSAEEAYEDFIVG